MYDKIQSSSLKSLDKHTHKKRRAVSNAYKLNTWASQKSNIINKK